MYMVFIKSLLLFPNFVIKYSNLLTRFGNTITFEIPFYIKKIINECQLLNASFIRYEIFFLLIMDVNMNLSEIES